jgi:hypothetical protein
MFDLLDPIQRVRGRDICNEDGCSGTYPDIEVEVLVVHRLDIEAYCGNGGNDLANLSDYGG